MGHLFVAHGDLTKLACDAILIPCDSAGNVNAVWREVLPAGLPDSQFDPGWLVLPGDPKAAGVIALPAVDDRTVWAFVTVDVDRDAAPEDVVERTWTAIRHVAATTAVR